MMGFDWSRIAERQIQEAIDEGKFDDLPGKGQPINLEEDMSTPPHLRVANRILKNAGVLPDWMQLDQEIDTTREEVAKSWERLKSEYVRRENRALTPPPGAVAHPEKRKADFMKWLARERAEYLGAMRRHNTDITKLLLIAPSVPRIHRPYKVVEEEQRFDDAFPPLPGIEVAPPPPSERDEAVKQTVRSLYASRRLGR